MSLKPAGLMVLSCLSLVGCGGPPSAQVKIGLLVDRSDWHGEEMTRAARLAVAEVNEAGGLEVGEEKHEVVLAVEITEPTPEDVVDAARRLIHQQQVIALVGPILSRDAIPAANLAESTRTPMISPGTTHPETTAGKSYVFRVACTDPFQGGVMARFASDELGLATAAVLYDAADVHIRGIAAVFQDAFAAAGGQVVAAELFTTGDRDFRRQLRRIREANPEALYLPNFDDEVLIQARQARRLGLEATLLGSDGWTPEKLADYPELEGAFLTHHWHLDLADANPRARAFSAAFHRAYDQEAWGMAALTYDALGLLFQAIRSSGRADPESIRQGLAGIERYPGVTGEITYRDRGGDPQKPVVIIRIRQGKTGVYQVIYPEEPPVLPMAGAGGADPS